MIRILSRMRQVFSIAIPEFASDLDDLKEKIYLWLNFLLKKLFAFCLICIVLIVVSFIVYLLLKQPSSQSEYLPIFTTVFTTTSQEIKSSTTTSESFLETTSTSAINILNSTLTSILTSTVINRSTSTVELKAKSSTTTTNTILLELTTQYLTALSTSSISSSFFSDLSTQSITTISKTSVSISYTTELSNSNSFLMTQNISIQVSSTLTETTSILTTTTISMSNTFDSNMNTSIKIFNSIYEESTDNITSTKSIKTDSIATQVANTSVYSIITDSLISDDVYSGLTSTVSAGHSADLTYINSPSSVCDLNTNKNKSSDSYCSFCIQYNKTRNEPDNGQNEINCDINSSFVYYICYDVIKFENMSCLQKINDLISRERQFGNFSIVEYSIECLNSTKIEECGLINSFISRLMKNKIDFSINNYTSNFSDSTLVITTSSTPLEKETVNNDTVIQLQNEDSQSVEIINKSTNKIEKRGKKSLTKRLELPKKLSLKQAIRHYLGSFT